jgi:hypothetical protein
MKAKEYIEKFFKEDDVHESLFKIVYTLFAEVETIAEQRNAQLNGAMISIFKEQDKKWLAILNKLGLLDYKGGIFKKVFVKYLIKKVPELEGRL